MIGADIKQVLAEVGSSIVILRDILISGEWGTIEATSQVTKPFVMSYFKTCTLAYDSQIVQGDILKFDTTQDCYLVTTINAEEFENDIVVKESILYLCNTSGELLRPSGEVWDANYHKTQAWETVRSDCYSLFINPEFRNQLKDEEAVLFSIEENELFLPTRIGVRVNDRYEPHSGEYFKVEVVNSNRYVGCDVCRLVEDHR